MYTIDQKIIPFIVACFSRNQNLGLTIASHDNNLEYEAYLGITNDIL
jgi:hypothetical protein